MFRRRGRRTALAVSALAAALLPSAAAAQLRPLNAFDWEVLAPGRTALVRLGAGVMNGQRLSLAGTEGQLQELGNFAIAWRTGRVVLVGTGTLVRRFEDRMVWAEPTGGALPPTGKARVDAGDFRVETAVLLTPTAWPVQGILRFGTRLPSSDNTRGLDRDRTDFYALVGARYARGPLSASVENGIGIFGTRLSFFEQADDWVYAARVRYRIGWLQPQAQLIGQNPGTRKRVIRGNEDLGELHLGARAGGKRWVEAEWVHGLLGFSPSSGLLLSIGATFGP